MPQSPNHQPTEFINEARARSCSSPPTEYTYLIDERFLELRLNRAHAFADATLLRSPDSKREGSQTPPSTRSPRLTR